MATFRITWKNDTVQLLEGEDITDAFNKVGYTKADIDALAYYSEYEKGSTEHPDYPFAQFACPKCMGELESVQSKVVDRHDPLLHKDNLLRTHTVYFYRCTECGCTTPNALDPLRSVIAMNIFCATGRTANAPELNRYYHAELDKHDMPVEQEPD